MNNLYSEEELKSYRTRKEELEKADKDLDRSFYSHMIKMFSMFIIVAITFVYEIFNYDTLGSLLALFLVLLFCLYGKILHKNFQNKLEEFRLILDKE